MAVTEGPVREEQLLHDMCLLGAVTVEITQILTRAGFTWRKYIWTPLKIEPGLVMWWSELSYLLHTRYIFSARLLYIHKLRFITHALCAVYTELTIYRHTLLPILLRKV